MIAQSDFFLGSVNSQFVFLLAIMAIVIAVYLAIFKPSGNFLLGYSTTAFGGLMLTQTVSFAKIIAVIQVLGVLFIFAKFLLCKNKSVQEHFLSGFIKQNILAIGLVLLLWVKILLDCTIYGMDEFKSLGLKILALNVVSPLLLLVFDREVNGPQKAIQHAVIGMLFYGGVFLAAALPSVFFEGGLENAFSAQYSSDQLYRFSTLGIDPINYGRYFFIGFCGCILMSLLLKKKFTRGVLYGLSACFFVFILASGTRQFLLAVLFFVFLLLVMLKLKRTLFISIAGGLLILAILVFITNISSFSQSGSVLDRFSTSLFQEEITSYRGAIWRDAFNETLDHFLMGVGFRNFGEPVVTINPVTGESSLLLVNAHGFFQDLFVEHGVFIGLAFLIAYIRSVFSFLQKSIKNSLADMNIIQMVGISFSVAEFFSGSVFGSIGVYLAILFMNWYDEEAIENSDIRIDLPAPSLDGQSLN